MKHIINIWDNETVRIYIRNRWHDAFSYDWNLINIERSKRQSYIEYRFCLIGFELVVSY